MESEPAQAQAPVDNSNQTQAPSRLPPQPRLGRDADPKRQRRTKIIATIGPSSCDPAQLEKLVIAGGLVFRINMSHSSHEDIGPYVAALRKLESKLGPIAILADLQGPKLRISSLAEVQVADQKGQRIVFNANHAPGTKDPGRASPSRNLCGGRAGAYASGR